MALFFHASTVPREVRCHVLKEHNTCPICRTPVEKNERGAMAAVAMAGSLTSHPTIPETGASYPGRSTTRLQVRPGLLSIRSKSVVLCGFEVDRQVVTQRLKQQHQQWTVWGGLRSTQSARLQATATTD